jgi:hypothetical protein
MNLLLNLTEDDSNSVAKDAALALINISANAHSARKWLETSGNSLLTFQNVLWKLLVLWNLVKHTFCCSVKSLNLNAMS